MESKLNIKSTIFIQNQTSNCEFSFKLNMIFEFETCFVCFDSFQCLIIFSQVDFKFNMNAANANANDEPVMPDLGLIPPNNNHRAAEAFINPHAQRRRSMLVPIDVFLINDHVMTFDNISINELSDPEI